MRRHLTVLILVVLSLCVFAPAANAGPVRNFFAKIRERRQARQASVCPCQPAYYQHVQQPVRQYVPGPAAPWGCYPPPGTYTVPGPPGCQDGQCPLRMPARKVE